MTEAAASPSAVQHYVERNYRWDFLVSVLDGASFWFGMSFIFGAIILPLYDEFTGAENRPTYIGLANTIPGVAGAIAPLIGGWLAGVVSYRAMFMLAAIIGVVSWVLLRFAVHEPRKRNAVIPEV